MANYQVIKTDVLVIGGGGAGCRAAFEASKAGAKVAIAFKGMRRTSGCTAKAVSELSAYSAAFGYKDPRDKPLNHYLDTVNEGAGLADEPLVRILATEAPECLKEVVAMGAEFNMVNGRFDQLLADASTLPRAVNCGADTGREILNAIVNTLEKEGNVSFYEKTAILKLLTIGSAVVGAVGIKEDDGEVLVFSAKSTVLATGGGCFLYSLNGQPADLTGTGYFLAYEAGAKLINMEMIQFGPAIIYPVKGYLLVTKFWRLKPRLLNNNMEEFLERYVPDNLTAAEALRAKEFAFPFNVGHPGMYVDIAMHSEISAGRGSIHGGIYVDVSHNDPKVIEETIPVTFKWFIERGVDIRVAPFEIAPVAQCFIGGIKIYSDTNTDVEGLYACGEAEGTVHGAARPGGNMLAASQVFGKKAGIAAARHAEPIVDVCFDESQVETVITKFGQIRCRTEGKSGKDALLRIQDTMWKYVSICRDKTGLQTALDELEQIEKEFVPQLTGDNNVFDSVLAYEVPAMLQVARAVARSALMRCETRGSHYRVDYPGRSEKEPPRCIEIQGPGSGTYQFFKPRRLEDFYLK